MTSKTLGLVAISVLITSILLMGISSDQFAEAKKEQRHKISKWMGNTVCGDQLCEGQPYFKWNFKARTYKSPYDAYTNQELTKIKTR
jgi:hypothetical protein